METDTETDTPMDMDMDTDTDKDKDTAYGAIAPYGLPVTHHGASSNSVINLWCKFQQHYKLVAPLPNENYDMLLLKNNYLCWDFSLNTVSAELEISSRG
jgi:hypothetical protein